MPAVALLSVLGGVVGLVTALAVAATRSYDHAPVLGIGALFLAIPVVPAYLPALAVTHLLVGR